MDAAVKGLQGQIIADHKDVNTREYGAILYQSEGSYHYGEIQRGTTVQESKDGRAGVALYSDDAAKGIPKGSTLVGDFHTHPSASAPGVSGKDLMGVALMRSLASRGVAFDGYEVNLQYQGYNWRAGDGAILNYKYPGKVTPIFNADNAKYRWVQ